MVTDLDILTHVSLSSDLMPGDLTIVASRFHEDTFAQDAYIFFEGDPARHLWVVKDGQVKIVKHGDGGKETVIEVIPPSFLSALPDCNIFVMTPRAI